MHLFSKVAQDIHKSTLGRMAAAYADERCVIDTEYL